MSAAKRKTAKPRTMKTAAAKTGRAKTRTTKTGARKTAGRKTAAAKAKARPPKRQQAACVPELSLAAFLIDLAINEGVRNDFNADAKAAMERASLSEAAMTAIEESKQNDLLRLICVSQQNT
jgi:hypothetical protein